MIDSYKAQFRKIEKRDLIPLVSYYTKLADMYCLTSDTSMIGRAYRSYQLYLEHWINEFTDPEFPKLSEEDFRIMLEDLKSLNSLNSKGGQNGKN